MLLAIVIHGVYGLFIFEPRLSTNWTRNIEPTRYAETGNCGKRKNREGVEEDWCPSCFKRGIPCSHTRLDWLGGPQWDGVAAGKQQGKPRSKNYSGPLFEAFRAAVFVGSDPDPKTLQWTEIVDPGLAVVPEAMKDSDDVYIVPGSLQETRL